MSNPTLVIVVVIAVAVVLAVALMTRAQRRARLKARFGPEYNRVVEETGSAERAEAKLEKLANRVDRFKIVPLSATAREDFVAAWTRIQGRFVDDPSNALSDADRLIQKLMRTRGYPVSDFEQRARDLSVDHPEIVEHYREGHAISVRHAEGRANTEDMRQAMIHFRMLFEEMAGASEVSRAARAAGA
ncbi:MAG: hypothetical protein WAK20_09325 [Candidatus Acidiferrum sp.]